MQSPEPPTSAVAQKNELPTQQLDSKRKKMVKNEGGDVVTRGVEGKREM